MKQTFVVAWYRFRGTFARRWTGYLTVIVLIGLTGGLAMAAFAGARRTQSSYPIFLQHTNPSTLTMAIYSQRTGVASHAPLTSKIRNLPDVRQVRTLVSGAAVPLSVSGAPRLDTISNVVTGGSLDGYPFNEDHLSIVQGKFANPKSLNQIVVTAGAARIWGVGVGQKIPIGFYNPDQEGLAGFGTPRVKPRLKVDVTVTGIVVMNSELVQDDIDRSYGFAFMSRAMTERAATVDSEWKEPVYYAIQLRRGDEDLAHVERRLIHLVPPHYTYEFHVASSVTSTIELAVKPESVTLGAFGLIAELMCLILSVQALSRQMRHDNEDRRILHSLGASRSDTLLEGLLGGFATLLVGVFLSVVVAVALSPLAPLGPVRSVFPDRGLSADWTVLGGGAVILLLTLGVAAAGIAVANAPHRTRSKRSQAVRRSMTVQRLRSIGLPLAPSLGAHLALESPRGRNEVPVRSVMIGAVLAVTLMVTTLTFASGLNTLVSRPALYGWDWSYTLNPSNDVPPVALASLRNDPDVAAWTGISYNVLTIDGQTVPMLIAASNAKVVPPILTGHKVRSKDEIVVGNQTLDQLHKHVGETVVVSYGSPNSRPLYIPPTTLTIVGTSTFPAVGYASSVAEHTAMGTGALVSTGIEPTAFVSALRQPDANLDGPELVFVRLRADVSPEAGRKNLNRIAYAANEAFAHDPRSQSNTLSVLGVQRPSQIVDYRSVGDTPVILATSLAVGAIIALALTLIASVRRRRRELAILKTLGLSRRTLAAAVSWQATIDAAVGAVVGVPLGIFLGRELWTLFARSINAVPYPTVPAEAVTLVGIATLVIANFVAFWPGHSAARTPPGLVLRSE
ncbi:MAG: FtsX-like permease family protein [Acidimicrobiales bacterium]